MAFLAALNNSVRGGATPVSQLTASKDFARFLEVNALSYDVETGLTWLMFEAVDVALGAAINVPRVAQDQAAMTCALAPPVPPPAGHETAYFDAANQGVQVLAMGVPTLAFRALLGDSNKSLYWLLDLCACHQIKPLKPANIANFFRMTSRISISGRELIKVLDYAAVSLPKIVDDENLFGLLAENQFMTYHTAYSSTATLAAEMLDSAPAVTNVLFSEATRGAVEESRMNMHDRDLNAAISQQVVLATYAYLSAFNKLPDNWFQGEKARSSLPATRYNQYLAIFKRIKTLAADVAAINEAVNMEALVAAIGADLQGV